jgi:glycerophosphoryl diester phosphodiesterase
LDEIRRLDAGSWFVNTDPHQQIAAGNISKKELDNYNGLKVPTLAEAIELTKKLSWQVNLELKIQPGDMKNFPLVDRLLDEIERLQFSNAQFVVSSFNHEWLKEIQKKKPGYRVEALVGYPITDTLNWKNFEFECYNVNRNLTNPSEIMEITNKGYKIGLFNIDTKADFNQFIDAGATSIITDYPQIMTALGYHR